MKSMPLFLLNENYRAFPPRLQTRQLSGITKPAQESSDSSGCYNWCVDRQVQIWSCTDI